MLWLWLVGGGESGTAVRMEMSVTTLLVVEVVVRMLLMPVTIKMETVVSIAVRVLAGA